MLTPHKHLNLKLSVINVAAVTLILLKKYRTMEVQALMDSLSGKLGKDVQYSFEPAINFLFLTGKIAYHPKNDSFEFRAGISNEA